MLVKLVTPKVVAVVVVGLALVAGCGAPTEAPSGSVVAPRAAAVTNDQLNFTAKTVDGADFSGASLVGKASVLWFWAPWCTTCQGEAPSVARAARAHPGVRFVGVAAEDQVPAMQAFVAKYQLGSFTHLADLDASVWRRFGVTAQPAFAFIRPDGTVDVVKTALPEQELNQRLDALSQAG